MYSNNYISCVYASVWCVVPKPGRIVVVVVSKVKSKNANRKMQGLCSSPLQWKHPVQAFIPEDTP